MEQADMAIATASTPMAGASRGISRSAILWRVLVALALPLLVASYFAPIWWVALKAPNYPEHTFPVGIRIHFHIDGVRNGCEIRTSREVTEKEALDCVHEMDTINHFVGMYPIASGGPVEKVFSPFLFGFLGVLVVGFIVPGRRARLAVMGAGFVALAGWMTLAMFTKDGVSYLGRGYIHALVTSLGVDEEKAADDLHPIVRQLKESLAKSGIGVGGAAPRAATGSKDELIAVLRGAYEQDQQRLPAAERKDWTGSGMQVFTWHYEKSLGRWFNQPDKNRKLVTIMVSIAYALFAVLLAGMAIFLFLGRNERSPWFWALVLVPMILPAAFVFEYSGWLWWYGHHLNEMGAFTLKPFMPTVFGQGKVAQFITLSYPHYGFAFMAVFGMLLAVAALMRRRVMASS
jgi:hypothetical protein